MRYERQKFLYQVYIGKHPPHLHPFINFHIMYDIPYITPLILHRASSYEWKLINRDRKHLSLPASPPVGVCVVYSVWVQYGRHPGVAYFDTYSGPKPTVRLPPTPQVSPSP